MRRLVLLAAALAMVLVFAAPAAAAQTKQQIVQQCVGDVTQEGTVVQTNVASQTQVAIVASATQIQQQSNVGQVQAVEAACEQFAANVNIISFDFSSLLKGLLSIF